jgi:hypothetical protein
MPSSCAHLCVSPLSVSLVLSVVPAQSGLLLAQLATALPGTDLPLTTAEEAQNELFFDEQEVLAGAGADQRAAMLNHYDNLLDMPAADTLDEVPSPASSVMRFFAPGCNSVGAHPGASGPRLVAMYTCPSTPANAR